MAAVARRFLVAILAFVLVLSLVPVAGAAPGGRGKKGLDPSDNDLLAEARAATKRSHC